MQPLSKTAQSGGHAITLAFAMLGAGVTHAQAPPGSTPSHQTPAALSREGLPIRLYWSAPENCPADVRVLEEVQRLLRERRFEAEIEPIDATVRIDGSPLQLQLTMRRAGEPIGERTLNDAACMPLAQYVVTVLALAIDPEIEVPDATSNEAMASRLSQPAPGVSPSGPTTDTSSGDTAPSNVETPPNGSGTNQSAADSATRSSENASATTSPTPGVVTDEESRPQRTVSSITAPRTRDNTGDSALVVGTFVELGTLPAPSVAFALGGTFPLAQRGFLGVGAAGAIPVVSDFDGHASARANLWWITARVWSGIRFRPKRVELSAYGIAEAGFTGGDASGITNPFSAFTAWAALGLGAQFRVWVVKNLAFAIDGDGRIPLWRPAFIVDGVSAQAHQASVVVGRVGFNVALHFR